MIYINFIIKYLNIAALCALLLSYIAAYINPSIFIVPAFFAMAYMILLIINLLFLIWWIIKKKFRLIFSLVVILLGSDCFLKNIQFGSKTLPKAENTIKVVSFNSKLFGVYENKPFLDQFIEQIKEKKPNVICIQEFYNFSKNNKSALSIIKEQTGFKYHYFRMLKRKNGFSKYGSVILSQFKIINYGAFDYGKNTNNISSFADIKAPNGIFRIYNVHLQSLSLQKSDYQMLEKLGEDKDKTIAFSKNLFQRMSQAFIQRSEQAIQLKENINQSNLPIILCGDFNDVPNSFVYKQISKNLKDAFIDSGSGFGGTYQGPLPSFRIDYILHDPKFKSYNYKTDDGFGSDHKMLETIFVF